MTKKDDQESRITLAADVYEARRAARWLLGETYHARMDEWKRLIQLVMEREGVQPLQAVLVLSKHTDEAMDHLFLTAAAVEVIEQG